ncbi:hypothetical protein TRFO_15470 [Tritrichomonas foetus]|uniref:Cilia- and flagella-associated protein 52 n=1 Tax=Tritrichomonas foetus TaxID=1144522 RepID=A0A1J4KTQ1_9EUKA|nr:hypothetical protein TRFO_15470 [Tritrichomonas foetus]|eukprot:OHT14288.1 hypothetical protein TRFO_15470 [Tritrichomonas foetus]
MSLCAFRGFTPIHPPCLFINPIDRSIIYPSSRYVVVESPNGSQQFLREHDTNITAMDISPKGRMIAAGEEGIRSDVVVWRYSDRSLLFRFSEHDNGILCLAFSQDERLLATYGEEGRLVIWDMASGNIVTHRSIKKAVSMKWGGRVPDVKGGPTKTFYLATSGPDGVQLHIVDPQGTIQSEFLPMGKYTRSITSFAFTPEYLICGTLSSDFLIFELHSKTLVKVFSGGRNGITDIYTAPDGGILAGTGDGKILAVTELSAQEIFDCGHPVAGVYDTHVLTKDGYLFSNQGGEIWQSHSVPVYSIDCCGNVAVSAGSDRTIKVWDNRNMNCTLSFDSNFRSKPTCVSLSTHLLVAGCENGALGGFDFTTGERLFEILHCHHTAVNAVEIAPTRRFFATGGADFAVRIWDVRTREMLTHFKNHTMGVTSVKFLPTATHLYSSSEDMSVCLFDIAAEKMIDRLTGFDSHVTDVDVTGDYMLAVTQDGHIEKFCVSESNKPLNNVKTNETTSMSISPDGSKFAIGHVNGNVSIWDFDSFRKISDTNVHSHEVSDVRFFANNRVMVSGINGSIGVLSV